jgi:hypothetical protein
VRRDQLAVARRALGVAARRRGDDGVAPLQLDRMMVDRAAEHRSDLA